MSRKRLLVISVALILLISPTIPSFSQDEASSSADVKQLGASAQSGPNAPSSGSAGASVALSSQDYAGYAVDTANKVARYQWDAANSGYYSIMSRDWTSATDNSKQLAFKYWGLAWFSLYDRTGNSTYLSYAVKYMNTLLSKAWSNGFYDSYTNTWTPNTSVKSAAGNGITLWELSMAYSRTGNKTYYAYANKTANWIINNLWDSSQGCFWEDTATVGSQKYVEGCSDVIIGLMSLYGMNNNQTYLGYVSKGANFIISAWDSKYGGFFARVDAKGSCATITNGCNKYPNENTWPIIALSYYYRISGDASSKSYANRGISYIDSAFWDSNSAYNGGLFRSLYQDNTIRDSTKTAWDNCGEPWMIWVASENVGGNSTYQTLARRILSYCVAYLHDSAYGGFFTEVDRGGTTITFSTKDAESISDSIASLSLVRAVSASPTIPYLNLSVILANRLHSFMLNSASKAYYYEVSDTWRTVIDSSYSTLGNAFITLGMLQLYQATTNRTYLVWASSNAESFWRNGWDSVHGGFYDTYSANWKNTNCQQTTQPNALFELDFLRLASANGSAVWLQRANAVENLLNLRFWSASSNVAEQSYDVCTGTLSGDVHIEVSIGSYLWATAEWTKDTSLSTFAGRMAAAASFAEKYLWDGSGNTLSGGAGSTGCGTKGGYLGFMRSAYASLSGLEDCRKGANENIWGAMGLAALYNISASSTLLQFTSHDLGWINSTLWDRTNGGYHQNTNRDNTLRSACSGTNDPRDYPGWTEGEQPMFWWLIGHMTGNATESKWASVAEQWTAKHQWNSTNGNGGQYTCLNSNTLPDPGQNTLFDWLQGSALYTYSAVTGSAGTPPSVVQPLTATILENGAPTGTYTVNGCSASPSTGTTGTTTSFRMSPSCSFTISFANSGATRWGFISGGVFSGTSSTHSSCSSGTCSTISFNIDYQTLLTVTGGNGVSYSLKSETSDGWYDYGDSLAVSSNGIWNRANNAGQRVTSWSVDGGLGIGSLRIDGHATTSMAGGGNRFLHVYLTTTSTNDIIVLFISHDSSSKTIIGGPSDTAGLTWKNRADNTGDSGRRSNFYYYYAKSPGPLSNDNITVEFSSADTGVLEVFGIAGANYNSPFDPNSGLPASAAYDSGSPSPSVQVSTSNANDMIVSGVHVRISNAQPTFAAGASFAQIDSQRAGSIGVIGQSDEYAITSVTQSSLSVGFSVSGSPLTYDYIIADAIQQGGGGNTVATTGTVTTSSITMSASHTVGFIAVTQYHLTLVASPSAGGSASTSTNPTMTGDMGWYDSGTVVSISATANPGYTFSSWTGTGTGSYSGPGSSASATMNAAISETASFTSVSSVPLAIDGHDSVSFTSSSSAIITLTTSHSNDIILLFVSHDGSSKTITSVSDSAGLTWALRADNLGDSARTSNFWEYYAKSSLALSGDSITVRWSASDTGNLLVYGVSGANYNNPFDSHPGLPASQAFDSGTTSPSVSMSTSHPNDLIIAAVILKISNVQPSFSAGLHFNLLDGSDAGSYGVIGTADEYYAVTSAQSSLAVGFSVSGGSPTYTYMIADAIQGA